LHGASSQFVCGTRVYKLNPKLNCVIAGKYVDGSNARFSSEDPQGRSGAACHWSGAKGAASAGSA
jgi:hypothetical protein